MTENVTIRIGANATQAIREMDRVKQRGAGIREAFMGMRTGVGIAGSFVGLNFIREFTKPMVDGFTEATSASTELAAIVNMVNEGLKELGGMLGEAVIPVIRGLGEAWSRVSGFFGGTAAELITRGMFATAIPGSSLLTGKQYTSAASDQFVVKPDNETKRREEAMLQYARETTLTLQRMERDLATQQWTDPW